MNYLLTGPEEYLKERFIEKLKTSLLKNVEKALNFDVFSGEDPEIGKVLDSLNTFPFISKNRITVIKNIEKFSAKERDLIFRCTENTPPSTTIVLETRLAKPDKVSEKLSPSIKIVKCNKFKSWEIDSWIKKKFALRKKKISPYTASLMRKLAGENLFFLENEIEKIALFAGKKENINESDAEGVLGESPDRTAHELINLILTKRMDRIMTLISRLLVKEKPHRIISLLAWQFRNLIKMKELPKTLTADGISKAIGVNWRFARDGMKQSRFFSRRDLERNLEIMLEADLSMKSGKLDERNALKNALAELCR